MKELLTALAWPLDLRDERWLIVGAEANDLPNDLTDALVQRRARLMFAQWNELAALSCERFGVVVCPQLFYGLRHPLLALENVCTLTSSYALLHAPLSLPNDERALLRWNESADGWQTNRIALARLARSAGFARVADVAQAEACATWLQAFRQWPVPIEPLTPSLTIRHVFNPVTGLPVFPRSGRRAFVALVVAGLPASAQRWDVRVSIGGFGVQPIQVAPAANSKDAQINAPLPPGLPLGQAKVRLWHQQQHTQEITIEIVEGTNW